MFPPILDFDFQDVPHVSTLNLCLKKPDTLQKDSVQSCPEKTSKKWSDIAHLPVELIIMWIFRNILGIFSALDARIEIIPFALYQAPWYISLGI